MPDSIRLVGADFAGALVGECHIDRSESTAPVLSLTVPVSDP